MYQMVSLLQCGDGSAASKVLRKRRVKDLVAQVESLYLPWNSATKTKTSGAVLTSAVAMDGNSAFFAAAIGNDAAAGAPSADCE